MATIHLPPDFREFLQLLDSRGVEYLVVGGYKANKQASGRLKDLNDVRHLPD
jgi:hypothetical protein